MQLERLYPEAGSHVTTSTQLMYIPFYKSLTGTHEVNRDSYALANNCCQSQDRVLKDTADHKYVSASSQEMIVLKEQSLLKVEKSTSCPTAENLTPTDHQQNDCPDDDATESDDDDAGAPNNVLGSLSPCFTAKIREDNVGPYPNLNGCGKFNVVQRQNSAQLSQLEETLNRPLPNAFSSHQDSFPNSDTSVCSPAKDSTCSELETSFSREDFEQRYAVSETIGHGTYAKVKKASDRFRGRIVALKICPVNERKGLSASVLREVGIMQKMDHPNIVKVYGVQFLDDSVIIAEEYLPMTLHDYARIFQSKRPSSRSVEVYDHQTRFKELYSDNPWTKQTVYSFLKQILGAAAYMHQMMVIHRDLKLTNIVVHPTSLIVKIIDFGLASNGFEAEMHRKVITLWYRPLELFFPIKRYSTEVDMWSIGIIFFELLRGSPPIKGNNDEEQAIKLISKLQPRPEDFWASKATSNIIKMLPKTTTKCRTTHRRKMTQNLFKNSLPKSASRGTFKPSEGDIDVLTGLLDTNPKLRLSAEVVLQSFSEMY